MSRAINLVALATGILLGLGLSYLYWRVHEPAQEENGTGGSQPLYWVAPMDPNFRRDAPGKSPMGMDLIPVYAGEADTSPGTITVSPQVIQTLGVRTAVVERRLLLHQISTVGFVTHDEDRLSRVQPRVAGWIEQLHVRANGEIVAESEPIYDLYSPALVNAQQEFITALNSDDKALVAAAETRLISLGYPQQALATLSRHQQVRQRVTFTAPRNGVVEELKVRQGDYIQPGTRMMSIAGLDQVWVEAEVFEQQAALVRRGNPVTMTLNYNSGRVWRGYVDYVYPVLDPTTRTVRVRMRFDNEDLVLKPNMFAQVSIRASHQQVSLVVPKEAIIRTGYQNRVVLDLGGGRFKSVAVRVGHMDAGYAEVLAGLNDGDRVVTSAQFLIDSESSKQSDFKRIDGHAEQLQQASVTGTVKAVYPAERVLRIAHDPIVKWSRPGKTMNFLVDEGVALEGIHPNTDILFTFTIQAGEFRITQLDVLGPGA